MLEDIWDAPIDNGDYDLWVYGTNGFVRAFEGNTGTGDKVETQICYDVENAAVYAKVANHGAEPVSVTLQANAYRTDGPWTLSIPAGKVAEQHWELADSGNWYDFTLQAKGVARRFAGRLETGKHTISDPAMAIDL